jgi:D-glycero-D-manno-heptose 1,7-bisphosphate phosphatase
MRSIDGTWAEFAGAVGLAVEPDHEGENTARSAARPAVFLDRDGVINVNRADHVKRWDEFEFLSGAIEAIVELTRAELEVFVITNQAIVNRGMVPRDVVEWINLRMQQTVEEHGGRITAVAYCPHRPDEVCGCRKPRPGLLFDLARCYDIDLAASVVVGDALSDIEAATAAGCRSLLVLTGRGHEQLALAHATGRDGFEVTEDLRQAVAAVLNRLRAWPAR